MQALPEGMSDEYSECSEFKRRVLATAVARGLITNQQPMVGFIDTDGVRQTIAQLNSAFPTHFRHTFAAKANSMKAALAMIREEGLGCEAASPGEFLQALRVGFDPSMIVYDEPAKSTQILTQVLKSGASLNIDNFSEFEEVASLYASLKSNSIVGFRINPQIGAGNIGAMSTATTTSKFGIALEDEGARQRLIELYRRHDWLTSIHTHIGSQGCTLELMQAGIAKVIDLVEMINDAIGQKQISTIDIGGGLPVNFESEDANPTFSEYSKLLQANCPLLFNGKYTVKTEFGRSIFAKNGFIASKVRYTKSSGGRRIAIGYAGAQVATRTVFMPDVWALRLSVFDQKGHLKQGNKEVQDVGGPCCFAGDLVAKERWLPRIESEDIVVLHDTGAYYFSTPFFYNCLPAPPVYGVNTAKNDVSFEVWRAQQSLDEVLSVVG